MLDASAQERRALAHPHDSVPCCRGPVAPCGIVHLDLERVVVVRQRDVGASGAVPEGVREGLLEDAVGGLVGGRWQSPAGAAHLEANFETGIAMPLHECVKRCEADRALRPLLVVPQRADQLVDLAQGLSGEGLDRCECCARTSRILLGEEPCGAGVHEDHVDRVPRGVVEVPCDPGSFLGGREASLAQSLAFRLTSALLEVRNAFSSQSDAVTEHPGAAPDQCSEEGRDDRELIAAIAGRDDVGDEEERDDDRCQPAAVPGSIAVQAHEEERDRRTDWRPGLVLEHVDRSARRGCRRECCERRGPARKEWQRGKPRENHTERIEAPGVGVIRDSAAGERRHRQREDAERDPDIDRAFPAHMSSVAGVSYHQRVVSVLPQGYAECPPDGRCGGAIAASSVGAMTSPHTTSRLERLADLTYRRRWRVVIAWIAILAATLVVVPQLAGEYGGEFGTPGSESKATADLLEEHFDGSSGETVNVVWEAPAGARQAQHRIGPMLAEAERVDGVAGGSEPRYSRDGTIGLVQLRLERSAMDLETSSGTRLIDLAENASSNGLRVEVGGNLIQQAQEGQPPELMGLLAAAVVLLIAFGSVVAAGLPLLVAIFGLGISASLIGIVALLVDTPDFAPAVAGLIGIGVGIDYSLLILTRFRSAMMAGADERAALAEAVTTAGRSVIVAGGTVMISLLGLSFMGVSFLYGVAISASLAVLVVVLASITLLPALLAIAGRRVDRLRIPGLGRSLRTGGGTLATRWSRLVQRRAGIAAAAGAAVLILLTLPVLGLRYGFPDEGNDPDGSSTRAAYELVSRGFGPGSTGPLLVASEETSGLEALADNMRREEGVSFVTPIRTSADGEASVFSVMPATSPQDAETADLVDRLRDLAPQGVYVGGLTAAFVDQSDYVSGRIPLFIAGVVGLSFVLLLLAFRAPLIALKAGVMNLLSVGAAYGVVALAAEGGWFGSLIGVDTDTPIPPFIPVMMFAVLFGLSMDYEVFLLSRIREEYRRTGETHAAVTSGLAKTARVITAAAAIMVVVFLAFIFSTEVFLKLMGLGMATAILVDATIVRMVLVPAVMQLLGPANWWTPRWLDRVLPRLDGEPVRVPATAGERG